MTGCKSWGVVFCAAVCTLGFDSFARDLPPLATKSSQGGDVKLRLTGVITGKVNLAIISVDDGKERPFKVGASISPGTTLLKVTSNYAVVSYNGIPRRLDLNFDFVEGSSAPPKAQPAAAGIPPFKPPRTVPVSASAIKDVGNGRWAVKRVLVDEELRSGDLFSDARIVSDTSGRVRIIEIRPGSLYDKLGLKDGDILNDPSGNALKSIDGLLRFLYDQQMNSRALRLQRVRDGTASDFEIVLE